jgi:hypothetical protein
MYRKYILQPLVLTVFLLLAACGGLSADVFPISEIVTSGPEFTNIGPTTATLLAETSIPVACSVVYGTTSDYGEIATDSDMAGGGHQDHHPLLTGLEPDTQYFARIQGTGPNGTIYRSEELTFRTLAESETSGPPNLALSGRVAGVSSNYNGEGNDSAFGANNAIDGDPGTEWSSDGEGNEAWIEIELASPTRVTRVGFWTRTMGTSAQIESFAIVNDGGDLIGPFEVSDASGPHYYETDFTASRLRFEVMSSSGGNTGVVEIEIYGEPQP